MKFFGKISLLLLTLLASVEVLSAQVPAPGIRVIEEGAISYMRFLSKVDFDQRFPGKNMSGPEALDSGWYVIYEHESLNYYFGPMLLESTGKDYLSKLEETVDAAVAQRPSITDYRLELSYEPSVVSSDPNQQANEPASGYGTPPPESKPSIWTFIRRLFGL